MHQNIEKEVYEMKKEEAEDRMKSILGHYTINAHYKSIGLWSPYPEVSLSKYIIDLALYLNKISVPVVVAEVPDPTEVETYLWNEISKFSSSKGWKGWESFYKEEGSEEQLWRYDNICWLASSLENKNISKKKISNIIKNLIYWRYLTIIKLPNGCLDPYFLDLINSLDEIWIYIKDYDKNVEMWKRYIETNFKLPVKLVFPKKNFFDNRPKRCSIDLNITLQNIADTNFHYYTIETPKYLANITEVNDSNIKYFE
ncbi:hypothetical protein DZB84_20515 [Bacillus sp. HNG]|uniref:hypothetical protein n=1 Tax=Bacillus sp. HNG TaxID=2293325 RepID=UPI000E2F82C6|nr:hypothetical protein [Bacillus sp. HNG]RFB11453.1 hypothetical protein DZB84_20515 [Bacillus sp. HNG]